MDSDTTAYADTNQMAPNQKISRRLSMDAGDVAGDALLLLNHDGAVQLADLLTAVTGVGPGTSLADKVIQVQTALSANHVADACSGLNALINELKAQSGRSIPPGVASSLIGDATRIRAVLGC